MSCEVLPGEGGDKRFSSLGEDFFPEMACTSAFDGVQILVNPSKVDRSVFAVRTEDSWGNALISTVDGNINDRVLIDISESQVGSDDEFFGLES